MQIKKSLFFTLLLCLLVFITGCNLDMVTKLQTPEKETESPGAEMTANNTRAAVYYSYPWQQRTDVNGDGYIDLVAISGSDAYVIPGTSSGGFNDSARQYMNATYFSYPWKQIIDVNNDGYKDFVGISGTHAYVVPGTNTGRFNKNARNYMNATYFSYPQKSIYDTNGDGYKDFVGISPPHKYVVPGTASGAFDYNARIYTTVAIPPSPCANTYSIGYQAGYIDAVTGRIYNPYSNPCFEYRSGYMNGYNSAPRY